MPKNPETALDIGTRFIETLWYAFACRIVDKAVEIYKLNDQQSQQLKTKFLKRGDFMVLPR
jgi:hypothetical protein